MRKFRSEKQRQTYERFEKCLQLSGLPPEGLDVQPARGGGYSVCVGGEPLGVYDNRAAIFRAANDFHYHGVRKVLTHPDGNKERVLSLSEALSIIMGCKK